MAMEISIQINGVEETFEVNDRLLLLWLLRSEGLTSVKHGCETGDCGACAVLVNGRPVVSCIMLAAQAHGKRVVTLEGMNDTPGAARLQRAFTGTGAIQCGYCTPAMILVAKALLDERPRASEAEVREALDGVLCRCTGYVKPVEAILRATEENGGEGAYE